MPNVSKAIQVHPDDNVAVAVSPLCTGESIEISGNTVTLKTDIPAGHKFALADLARGSEIIKYGFRIGRAESAILRGDWVHEHNIRTALAGSFAANPELVDSGETSTSSLTELTFTGYRRKNGEVGIRNEIWIIPTVGCVNATVRIIAQRASSALPDGIDGCYAFEHPYGCSQLGGDHERTKKILAGLVNHPNAAGVLIVGLGCENNQLDQFREELGDFDPERIRFMITQEVDDELTEAERLLSELKVYASGFKPEEIPLNKLRIGLKCGGSDAFSGLTANPLLGVVSEMVVNAGGSVALTEIPEVFGAEDEFLPRCIDRETCDKAVKMINDFRDYFIAHGEPVSENPSPGNRKGGITTLEEKSLGCVQKGGRAPIVDVLDYGERIRKPGLSILNGPGNDIVAVTNLAAAGVHITLFTTGRGTPLGSPVPCLKVATNSDLFNRKSNWIDFNAGKVLEGVSMYTAAEELLRQIIDTASNRRLTRSEEHNYRDIAIFKSGVTL